MLLPAFSETFYLIEDSIFILNFANIHRTSLDCGFELNFKFSLKHKKNFDHFLDRGQLPMILDHSISEYKPNLYEKLPLFKPYLYKSKTKNKISKDFKNYYYTTQFLLFFSNKVTYKDDLSYDYDLAIHSIKIGANGHAIFLFINFIEKFFKSYLIDQHYYTPENLKDLSHDIKKIWKEIDKKISKKKTFNDSVFTNKIKHLKSFYSANLRYENKKYDTLSAVKVNLLALDIIEYFLFNTNHNFKEMDMSEIY